MYGGTATVHAISVHVANSHREINSTIQEENIQKDFVHKTLVIQIPTILKGIVYLRQYIINAQLIL